MFKQSYEDAGIDVDAQCLEPYFEGWVTFSKVALRSDRGQGEQGAKQGREVEAALDDGQRVAY